MLENPFQWAEIHRPLHYLPIQVEVLLYSEVKCVRWGRDESVLQA